MEACVHPKSQQKTRPPPALVRGKKSKDYFFLWDSGAEVTASPKEESLYWKHKKNDNNRDLWWADRKLPLCWGSVKEKSGCSWH